ncbi:hypothetical protein [Azohydromonas caseinilytica]|uniref:Uncharacterized protein n=1 Tax=Azohydromonas caseinilytica TaxID=2728836 RepID=A0A848FDJ7_9BURK|nr:hypothetical protein [Azohydromonas caseinilytica]NML17382.1 hypothetical protein [Azohydromonas caseinilytica]
MARQSQWQHEMREAVRVDLWSVGGPNRIVKVVPAERPLTATLKGYVCLEKSLLGKTPIAIEAVLGLPHGFLAGGCRVYRFKRLPMTLEIDHELTAHYPDGQAFNPAMHDAKYPPGSNVVHQWRLLVDVPVQHLIDLRPGEKYPYMHQ